VSKLGDELAPTGAGLQMAVVRCTSVTTDGASDGTDIIFISFGGTTMRCPYSRALDGTIVAGDSLLMLYDWPRRFLICKVGGANYSPSFGVRSLFA